MLDVVKDLLQHPIKRYGIRTLPEIKYLVAHHTAADADNTPEEVARYHVEVLGWPGIGYAWMVRQDGAIYKTQELWTVSYHIASRNQECVGICLTGNFNDHWPTKSQTDALRWLINKEAIPRGWTVSGHKYLAAPGHPTACPGDTTSQWLPFVRQE